jgi:hypothetical protein
MSSALRIDEYNCNKGVCIDFAKTGNPALADISAIPIDLKKVLFPAILGPVKIKKCSFSVKCNELEIGFSCAISGCITESTSIDLQSSA